MPKHCLFVLRPTKDGQLTAFLRWLTNSHKMRWYAPYHKSGTGRLDQGRFTGFRVEDDDHLYTAVRHVERNNLRAGLVRQAQAWRLSSLWRREYGDALGRAPLARRPDLRPRDWVAQVNVAQTEAEMDAVRRSSPIGGPERQRITAGREGLQATLRTVAVPASIEAYESSLVPSSLRRPIHSFR
ncbi:MAG: hypothetical protein ACHRXM_35135 [Isosphaerales bacterium]